MFCTSTGFFEASFAGAEEHAWRAGVPGATGWDAPAVRAPEDAEPASPAPEQIAAIYRALRKGREDGKDEPGAADFYYGEMEMRRQPPRGQEAERRTAPTGELMQVVLRLLGPLFFGLALFSLRGRVKR